MADRGRYWGWVGLVLAVVAIALPAGRVVHTLIGDAQCVAVLLLLAVLGWLVQDRS